jgi:hypothetical protein
MSARSTGVFALTVTVPLVKSTSTESTPGTAQISVVTACRQWSQVMPSTVKVVLPTNVRGMLFCIVGLLGVERFGWRAGRSD